VPNPTPKAISNLKPFKKGEGGRPKGSRNKLQEDFLKDFCQAWEKYGVQALMDVAASKPEVFVKVAASLMPKELKAEIEHRAVMRMPQVSGSIDEWIKQNSTVQ